MRTGECCIWSQANDFHLSITYMSTNKSTHGKCIKRLGIYTGYRIDGSNVDLYRTKIVGSKNTVGPRTFSWDVKIHVDSVCVLHDAKVIK